MNEDDAPMITTIFYPPSRWGRFKLALRLLIGLRVVSHSYMTYTPEVGHYEDVRYMEGP